MPDFKFTSGSEHDRTLAAIEAQKLRNAEYAKDPFVTPARLAAFDPAAYVAFEGDYEAGGGRHQATWSFTWQGDAYIWQFKRRPPLILYPAGDRLFVTSKVSDLEVKESKGLGKMLVVTSEQTFTEQDSGDVVMRTFAQAIYY